MFRFTFSDLHKIYCRSESEQLQCLYLQLPGITIAEVRLPHQTILEDHTHIRLHVHQRGLNPTNVMWYRSIHIWKCQTTEITKHTQKKCIPRGLQRQRRQAVKIVPFTTPYCLYACIEYSLQVGTYRQLEGSKGDISPVHTKQGWWAIYVEMRLFLKSRFTIIVMLIAHSQIPGMKQKTNSDCKPQMNLRL